MIALSGLSPRQHNGLRCSTAPIERVEASRIFTNIARRYPLNMGRAGPEIVRKSMGRGGTSRPFVVEMIDREEEN